jgi:hypothetical protein
MIKRISASDGKRMVQMYKKGMSLLDIAKRLDISKNGVRSSLLRQGVVLRDKVVKETGKPLRNLGKRSAQPPYGFCYFQGKVVRDPREFPNLQFIQKLSRQEYTTHQICCELNRLKIPSRKGKLWSWAAVQNILKRHTSKK